MPLCKYRHISFLFFFLFLFVAVGLYQLFHRGFQRLQQYMADWKCPHQHRYNLYYNPFNCLLDCFNRMNRLAKHHKSLPSNPLILHCSGIHGEPDDLVSVPGGVFIRTTVPPPDHCPKCSISCTKWSQATSENMGNQYTSGQGWKRHTENTFVKTLNIVCAAAQQVMFAHLSFWDAWGY